MDWLDELENRSIYIIREAYRSYRHLVLLWSMGKDSTTLVWLCRKAFFGKIPFAVMHIDTSFKFKEIYEFRDYYARQWGLDLRITRNEEALGRGVCCTSGTKLECCGELKTAALKQGIARHRFDALLVGIRRDEHGIRAKERHFSPRDHDFHWDYMNQPAEPWDAWKSRSESGSHVRVHPLLDWTELDVWRYVQREQLPVIDLYFARFGKRFRSIGCEPCCQPVDSDAENVDQIVEELKTSKVAERSGRAQDKEDPGNMQNLRSLGYL